MNSLAIIGFGLWALNFILVLLGTWLLLRQFRKISNSEKCKLTSSIPISILKPLKGVDQELEENLTSFFELQDPSFELLLSVESPEDSAFSLAKNLCRRYPQVLARVFVQNQIVGCNPKVNNLILPYQESRFEWLLISDSNTRVPKNHLETLRSQICNQTGIVTAVVTGKESQSFGGHLESMFLNTFYSRWMVLAAKLGTPCVLGKSMLFRKSLMDKIGGIKTLAHYIAEDHVAGQAMRKLGFQIKILSTPVVQHIGRHSIQEFWSRHIRWGRIRKSQAPFAFLGEGLQSCFLVGVLGASSCAWLGLMNFYSFLALHCLIWFKADILILWRFGEPPRPITFVYWFAREFLAFPLWGATFLGKTVYWRGRLLKIRSGGLIEESL